MDGGLFSGQRSNERRGAQTPEASRSVEEPHPAKEHPATTHRPTGNRYVDVQKSSKKRVIIPVVALIVVLLLAATGWALISKMKQSTIGATAIDTSKFQVVMLSNGQSYFGKLERLNNEYLKLDNVYFLQNQQETNDEGTTAPKASTENSNYKLIRLSDDIHTPEDTIVVSNAQVIYYENLKSDGKISQLISDDLKKR